eukprot:2391188-Pleurochrysis_carterae.AAC.1
MHLYTQGSPVTRCWPVTKRVTGRVVFEWEKKPKVKLNKLLSRTARSAELRVPARADWPPPHPRVH